MKNLFGLNWFTVVLLLIVAYFGYVGWQQQVNLSKIKAEKAEIETKFETVKEKNNALKAERDSLQSPENVEKIAREELGLVKPGEMPYIPAKR
jgi:cell division protein DivIC